MNEFAVTRFPRLPEQRIRLPHPHRRQGEPETLQIFVNTILADGWRNGGDELDEATLRDRTEPFGVTAIPADVLLLTVGVDVQDDRLE